MNDDALNLLAELSRGGNLAIGNAEELYAEAVLLKKNGHLSRALALHQISIEDCAKVDIVGAWATNLVCGGEYDHVLDVSSVAVMKPLLPQAEVVIIKDTGHIPMLERPAETAGHFLAFAEGIQAAAASSTELWVKHCQPHVADVWQCNPMTCGPPDLGLIKPVR